MSRLTTQMTVTVGGLRGPGGTVTADLEALEANVVEKAAQTNEDAGRAEDAADFVMANARKAPAFVPPLAPATYRNAFRHRFSPSSFLGATVPSASGSAPALNLVYDQAVFDLNGSPAVIRMADVVPSSAQQPRFTIPISVADLALLGLTPSDTAPPAFSARAKISLATLVNQTIDASTVANGLWYVVARYNGAGASLAGPINPSRDVAWLGTQTTPSSIGLGQTDPLWTAAGSTGSFTLTTDAKILVRNNVPLRATYGGNALSGLILMFFGQAAAAGATAFSVYDTAVIAGASVALDDPYYNHPEDDLSQIDYRNLSPALAAQIGGAAQEASVAARLAAKQEYSPPLKPTTYLNAVRHRYGATGTLPGAHGAVAGGVTAPVAANVYSDRFWTGYGEPSAMRTSGASTASGQNGPRCAYYITLADLTAIGVTPDNTTPPIMSFSGAIDLAASVAQNITNATGANGQFWVCLRYAGVGAALEGTSYNAATDVMFLNNGTGPGGGGLGVGAAPFTISTGVVAYSAAEKVFTRLNVPIPATVGGNALTGILIVFFGTTSASSGESAIVTGRVAGVKGSTINIATATLNKPEDLVEPPASGAGGGSATADHDWLYDAVTGTSLLTSSTIAPPEAGTDYLFLTYGQSWADGDNPSAAPLLTTAAQHTGKALMPSVGVKPSATFTAYADLRETGTTETISSGMADVIMTRLNARVGAKPRAIFAVAALGGQAIAGGSTAVGSDLGVGSNTFEKALGIIASCVAVSAAAGRRLVVPAVVWMQGEQDYNDGLSRWLYKRGLIRMRQAFDAKIREMTGQKEPVMMYTYLTNRGYSTAFRSNDIALAQLQATKDDPFIRTYGAVYWCPDGGDGSHSTPTGYRGMGNQAGNAIVEDWFGPYWEPLRVVESYWSAANKFCLRFTMPLAIEADDSKVTISTLDSGKGIQFDDGSGAPPAITGIALKAGTTDTVEVTLASAPTGLRKRYWIAMRTTGANTGAVTGARSGVRSASSYWTDSLTGLTMYHWACPEEGQL